ncbi:hypothetical protein GCM10017744_030560 [Streptomyces antimycoticus]|uniref:Uncharacterized protein n=1 Tax=Streptomyces antimycoticus TaxID=68175 RepID=A0A4D4KK95_9ACTN|nr:DUF6204 family protein [Streptomyces antimycoticus]GDY46293.1 hypothetical protein SANT12839_071750 [Streptomyces antimycoticus]
MFRVTIRGAFEELGEDDREALRSAVDSFQVGFTEAGTFTCDQSLSAFTFRCQVPAEEPEDGEREATERAIAALTAQGYPHRILRVGVTDMRNIKIRRKGARR